MNSLAYGNAIYDEIDVKRYETPLRKELKEISVYEKCVTTPSSKSPKPSNKGSKCAIFILAIVVVTSLVAGIALSICFALEIASLKSKMDSLSSVQQLASSKDMLKELNESIKTLFDLLYEPPSSCASLPPSFPSGYYKVLNSNGSAVSVYCDMTRSCGGVTGGWMRVAQLDTTQNQQNSTQECPSDFRLRTDGDISTCVRNESAAGCSSTHFSTSGVNYKAVCGAVTAYQYRSPNAFNNSGPLDSYYVDGVSLTHGSPRQHIWTFAAALDEVITAGPDYSCPCIKNTVNVTIPSFVGSDYFCDTASRNRYESVFYNEDPLWDGAGCGPLSTCCSFNNPPWFYKQLPESTDDDIEMRVCRDQNALNEDIAIETVELYVR